MKKFETVITPDQREKLNRETDPETGFRVQVVASEEKAAEQEKIFSGDDFPTFETLGSMIKTNKRIAFAAEDILEPVQSIIKVIRARANGFLPCYFEVRHLRDCRFFYIDTKGNMVEAKCLTEQLSGFMEQNKLNSGAVPLYEYVRNEIANHHLPFSMQPDLDELFDRQERIHATKVLKQIYDEQDLTEFDA
ncbi:TPA: hypothetical protein DF272_00045 [Candidatus Falkowbacteria bacterium]|nr:hypothetical protein [Candidatus Falkowbacteria bacterium]